MLLNALIKKDPLLMTSSVSEFKPILDKCSWANTWILYIAWIFQKIICERISLWIWHIKTSKCSGLAGSFTKQMAFAECTSMQWCLHESRVSGAVSFPHKWFRERRFHSDSPSLTSEDTTERLDKWIKMITQPFWFFTVHLLKRTLQRCEKNGWLEQISGKGFSGTFQLCFPYYPR